MRSSGSLIAKSVSAAAGRGRRVGRPVRRLQATTADRLFMGVPWGTLVIVGLVLASYLFVQDGITDFAEPVTIPYRAWSYFSPLGILTASFAHAGPGHLIGNLVGTLVAAPIAEYAWGHYPGGTRRSGNRWRDDPRVRAIVVFPLVAIGIGLVTSLFALGPVIGFSGVVFAFAGFAIVRYPITTVIATVVVQGALLTLVRAVQTPILVHVAQPSPPSAPGWATIAIQGHALGFLIGLLLAVVLFERRDVRASAGRLWVSLALYGLSKGLWQIYWFGEGNTYILFQLPGVLIVLTLVTILTIAITGSRKPVLPRRLDRYVEKLPFGSTATEPESVEPAIEATATADPPRRRPPHQTQPPREPAPSPTQSESTKALSPRTRRGMAFTIVVMVCAVVAGIAIPVNLVVVEADHSPETAIEVADYTISYGEGVENQFVSGIGFDAVLQGSELEANGVIVASEARNLWWEAVSSNRLAFSGSERIVVGGPGWRETVYADRAGWEPVGNDTVYQVHLGMNESDRQLAFESAGATVDVRLQNRTLGVASEAGTFYVAVGSAGTDAGSLESASIERAPVPEQNESVTLDGVTIRNQDDTLYAGVDGTLVAVAHKESYT